jgi:hypothetical protein
MFSTLVVVRVAAAEQDFDVSRSDTNSTSIPSASAL